jgi:D-threo-aldose 1-dehydrogenase
VLEFAYDLGIRHFDVAPMYGLGVAEAELADFVGSRTDIRIATKFGIEPTAIGRFAGRVQRPIRQILRMSPQIKSRVKQTAIGPNAGAVARLLYSWRDYSVENARRGLVSSLRALRTEQISHFLLHEPVGPLSNDHNDLIDFLETERRTGRIDDWGPAGDLSQMDTTVANLSKRASVVQVPYNLITGYSGPASRADRPRIVYGILSQALRQVKDVLMHQPKFRQECNQLLDADLSDPRTVVQLLVRDSVRQNKGGTVLISSTRTENLELAYSAASVPLSNEAEVASMIRQKCLYTRAEQ